MSLKKYQFYGKDKNGSAVPIFEGVWDGVPTKAMVDAIYTEFSRQMMSQGAPIGSIPRPTHYAVLLELHEIEDTGDAAPPILLHGNGKQTVH